ncbi:hypothetical protein [Phenylobacterium sp.]|uniref:hypothetical protein n=1 Tax=Phenylobacterium sp. TaxID=1871053 RepID=UPI00286CEABD|nr:hypothetical protein [Phenylobacterium sp.]
MNPTIDRLKLIFLGIFAVANLGILVWTVGWTWPQERCSDAHRWWDDSQRVCAQPVLISDLTGRVVADPKARAEAMAAIGRRGPKP